jgi:choline dehydrogenase-like flavoprotein
MGHVEGIVADVHFATPPPSTICGYERDVDGTYVRRRLGLTRAWQHRQQIPNVVAWLANPALSDPEHRSGELSLAYLALRSPLGRAIASDAQRLTLVGEHIPGTPYPASPAGPIHRHLLNVAREPGSAMRFAVGFGARRFLTRGRRAPGFFSYSERNTYPWQYHGEHLPHYDSRVTLSDERDSLGMPRLRVDIRYTDEDVDGVVRSHGEWDAYLRRTGLGFLEYRRDDIAAAVRENLGGGLHQIGTTRMSRDANDGVVDADLAIHGVPSIYVASSSAFVTSGQANSTFMIIAFAVRLANHVRRSVRR